MAVNLEELASCVFSMMLAVTYGTLYIWHCHTTWRGGGKRMLWSCFFVLWLCRVAEEDSIYTGYCSDASDAADSTAPGQVWCICTESGELCGSNAPSQTCAAAPEDKRSRSQGKRTLQRNFDKITGCFYFNSPFPLSFLLPLLHFCGKQQQKVPSHSNLNTQQETSCEPRLAFDMAFIYASTAFSYCFCDVNVVKVATKWSDKEYQCKKSQLLDRNQSILSFFFLHFPSFFSSFFNPIACVTTLTVTCSILLFLLLGLTSCLSNNSTHFLSWPLEHASDMTQAFLNLKCFCVFSSHTGYTKDYNASRSTICKS